ncbi:MAG: hypothetical protein ACREON_11060 [Gemmatimonadaceae bacterium]
MSRIPTVAASLMVVATACAGQSPRQPAPTRIEHPLAVFAGRPLVVLPARFLREGDSLGWAAAIPSQREYLASLDAEIGFAFKERDLGSNWVLADAMARAARRNTPFAPDPHALAAERLRPPIRRRIEQLPEPLASQLRSLVALNDARYVLYPLEIRFEKAADGGGRAVLFAMVLDARLSTVMWMGEVASDPVTSFSPALAAGVAARLADLIAAP